MTNSRVLSLIACASMFAAPAAMAAESAFECPASIVVEEGPKAVETWTVNGAEATHAWRYVSFFDGDPKEMVELAPSDDAKGKKLTQKWELTRNADRAINVICRYHDTEATLSKELPVGVKGCTLTGEINDKGEIQGSPTLMCK